MYLFICLCVYVFIVYLTNFYFQEVHKRGNFLTVLEPSPFLLIHRVVSAYF